MTGELSLIGKVLPVGGIKEKILAARRAGIQSIILPELNRKDMSEVPAYAVQGLKLHFVNHLEQVFDLALESKPLQSQKVEITPRVLRTRKITKPTSRPAALSRIR